MNTEATIQIGSLTIPPAEQTPLVLALVEIIQRQDAENKALRDEIHKLKGTTGRPMIVPSLLLKPEKPKSGKSKGKRPGSQKRRKTRELQIHEDVPLVIEGLPASHADRGLSGFRRSGSERRGAQHAVSANGVSPARRQLAASPLGPTTERGISALGSSNSYSTKCIKCMSR